jgi:hypothetical protein
MAYTIDKYNGTTVAVVEDGTIDSTLDIKLIGKNYAGYGEAQNENFVHILENFAGTSAPPRPISGQLWYNTSNKKLSFYDASTTKWKTAGGSEASTSEPSNLSEGDFWFDTGNKQLYVKSGTSTTEFTLIGPQGIAGLGTTQMKSMKVTDNALTPGEHAIIAGYVGGSVMFVVSADSAYTLSTASKTLLCTTPGGSDTSAFDVIKPGITLVNTQATTNGKTASGRVFWGTAQTANGIINDLSDPSVTDPILTSSDFVLKSGSTLSFKGPPAILVKFSDLGYTLGDADELEVYVDGGTGEVFFERADSDKGLVFKLNDTLQAGNKTLFKFLSSTQSQTLGGLAAPAFVGDVSGTANLGHPAATFNRVYASEFKGVSDKSDTLKVGASYRDAAVDTAGTGTANTIAVRDTSGRLCAAAFLGNATSATTAATSTNSDNLKVGASYRAASVGVANTGTPNTIVCTSVDGDINARLFQGTATSALFADLAEKYLADDEYEVGTVVTVGGTAEVTACQPGDRAFGAVSASPAYLMNTGLEGGTAIALKGRVPVKVFGAVKKGDRLLAYTNGCATTADVAMKNATIRAGHFPDTFAIALENNDDTGIKLVESIIL